MKTLLSIALVATLATPVLAADLKITTSKHTDAVKMPGMDQPAQDSTETMWVGKDRMCVIDGDTTMIVRSDLKKMYFVHAKDKTYSVLDLPFDITKYMPPEMAEMMAMMTSEMKVTLTPTEETKKVKEWNTTKYVLKVEMNMMGMTMANTVNIWTTKDVKFDAGSYNAMQGSMMLLMPGGAQAAAEFKKIEGFPVLRETTNAMMGAETKSKEEVTAIESLDAPEGTYEVPKDFTEKKFDAMSDNPYRAGGGGGRPGRGGEKPRERSKQPPAPEPK